MGKLHVSAVPFTEGGKRGDTCPPDSLLCSSGPAISFRYYRSRTLFLWTEGSTSMAVFHIYP